jgi:hypothetical protein
MITIYDATICATWEDSIMHYGERAENGMAN